MPAQARAEMARRPVPAVAVARLRDPEEREAERVAESVTRGAATAAAGAPRASDPLASMGARFGRDFSGVRIHADAEAARSARNLGALAYTFGRDIYFGAGRYAPEAESGRRLIAHELVHTMQQEGSPRLQLACDPAVLATRTEPVFFPRQRTIVRVFAGAETLARWNDRYAATGLIQQALVDLGYNLGPYGPNRDGVDRIYGPVTEQAVRDFQADQSIGAAPTGVVDQATLQCLDEERSHTVVQIHQVGAVPEQDYQVDYGEAEGEDKFIFFARGDSTLDATDTGKITRLAAAHRGCALTLNGYISEDERVDFGAQLAADRVAAVDTALDTAGQGNPGVCTPPSAPVVPLRTQNPLPEGSRGQLGYRRRRVVEVIRTGDRSELAACPSDAPRSRPFNPTEAPIVTRAISDGGAMMDTAIAKLTPGNAEGNAALDTFFGSSSNTRRNQVRSRLVIWRNHLVNRVPARSRAATECDSVCTGAIAYNTGVGAAAMLTVCSGLFESPISEYPGDTDQNRALLLIHEAGHGSINTDDVGYGGYRLLEFLRNSPNLALKNTDSFVWLVLCLNGLGCTLPTRADTIAATGTDRRNAQEGLAWLESWLVWSDQDASSAYAGMEPARNQGRWTDEYAEWVFGMITRAFDFRRPIAALPTFREQTAVSAIWHRYVLMEQAAGEDLQVGTDPTPGALPHWVPGSPGPSTQLYLTDTYFALTSARARVEMLLPVIIEATPVISPALRPAYRRFTLDSVRQNWGNHP